MLRRFLLAMLAPAALVVASACGGDSGATGDGSTENGDPSAVSGTVSIDGSSTVGPIAEAAAEEFGAVSDANVVVGISGTGGGFEKFCRGEIDIANASRPAKTSETQVCADNGVEMVEFKIGLDGLTVAVNPENTWANCLKMSQLRAIFDEGSTISNWNEVDPSFPDEPLSLYSPGADSGTFDFFTEEVNGTVDRTRGDGITFSEDDNVLVLGVESNKGAIGYFGYAYYASNPDRLKALEIEKDEVKGQPLATTQQVPCTGPTTDTIIQGRYPLSRPLYMYASKEALSDKPQVAAFLKFVMENPQLVSEVGYVEAEAAQYTINLANLEAN